MNPRRKMRTSFMQHCIRELIKEEGLEMSSDDQEEEPVEKEESKTQTKRGRKPIKEKWTRVISIFKDDLSKIQTYDLGPELLFDKSVQEIATGRGRPAAWEPIFWPPHLKK